MTLEQINILDDFSRAELLHSCCGSRVWVEKMLCGFPIPDAQTLYTNALIAWRACSESDWREAFSQHPAIGAKTTDTRAAAEQAGTQSASPDILNALAAANQQYEEKFGYTYIVFATGKSAQEMLSIAQARLDNSPEREIHVAMGEQEKITALRLEKLLS